MIRIFDTHTHLNVDNFAGKEQEEVNFAAELGVVKMNIVGFDKATIKKSLALSDKLVRSSINFNLSKQSDQG